MSLTSMIKGKSDRDKEFQRIIKRSLPKKASFTTMSGKTPFSSKEYVQMVPYSLTNVYYASVVGTAFDYLARIIVAQKIKSGKSASYKNLVAERGLLLLSRFVDEKTLKLLKEKYDSGIEEFKKFVLSKESYKLEKVIPVSCFLARLEHVARTGLPPTDIQGSMFNNEVSEIIKDLEILCKTFIEVFVSSDIVKETSLVIFNPTFGFPSMYCGGADADVYIDGVLYDFKTSKDVGYKWQDIGQIWGYYLLNGISLLTNDISASLIDYKIEKLAIYKARYGEIEIFDVESLDESIVESDVLSLKVLLGA